MFTVNTNVIQNLLDKAVRGCGSGTAGKINRPIDKMGLFEVNDGVLQVTTTNSSHFLKVRASGISGDNCSFVCADIYAVNALISKITTEIAQFTTSFKSMFHFYFWNFLFTQKILAFYKTLKKSNSKNDGDVIMKGQISILYYMKKIMMLH